MLMGGRAPHKPSYFIHYHDPFSTWLVERVLPVVASRGATTSIGHADVRTLVQTIASRIEKEKPIMRVKRTNKKNTIKKLVR